MTAKVWAATLQTLIDQKIITAPVDVSKAYTLTLYRHCGRTIVRGLN
jgi:hypothetical protein